MIAPVAPSFALLQSRTAVEIAALSTSEPPQADASAASDALPSGPAAPPPDRARADALPPPDATAPARSPAGGPSFAGLRAPTPDALAPIPGGARADALPPPDAPAPARPPAGGLSLAGLRAPASDVSAQPFAFGPSPASPPVPTATPPGLPEAPRGGAVTTAKDGGAGGASASRSAPPRAAGPAGAQPASAHGPVSWGGNATAPSDRPPEPGWTVPGLRRGAGVDSAPTATSPQRGQDASAASGTPQPDAASPDARRPAVPDGALPRGAGVPAPTPAPGPGGETSPGTSGPTAPPPSSEAVPRADDAAPAPAAGLGRSVDGSTAPAGGGGTPAPRDGSPGLERVAGERADGAAPGTAPDHDPANTPGQPGRLAVAAGGGTADRARPTPSDRDRATRTERAPPGGDGAAAGRPAEESYRGDGRSAFEAARAALPPSAVDHRPRDAAPHDAAAHDAAKGGRGAGASEPEGVPESHRRGDDAVAGSGHAEHRPSGAAQTVPGADTPARDGPRPAEDAGMTALGEALIAIAGRDWSGGVGTVIPCSVFNAAMIPGWPPPRPFDTPALDAAAARPLPTLRDEEAVLSRFAERGGAALGQQLRAMLKRTSARRRRRILSALAAVMDTIDAVLTALEAELLLASRAAVEPGEDELQTAGLRRRLTA